MDFPAASPAGGFVPNPPLTHPRRPSASLRWLRDIALSLILAFLIVLFVYQPVRVEGYSMMPRVVNNERLVINKFVYHWTSIHRGDVVVFRYPLNPRKSFIKRVIGLPGDRVQIIRGRVYINGRLLLEPYVSSRYRSSHESFPLVVVPPRHYFVLGDHRDASNDSRDWGCLARRYIFGKAVFAYWPVAKLGLIH
ncbi:MAG: signal peptidase I [Terriglobales bacterium]